MGMAPNAGARENEICLQFMTEKTTINDQYIEAMQQLAAVRIQLKMAMKLLLEARPAATGAAAERWEMQLDGLREEVAK